MKSLNPVILLHTDCLQDDVASAPSGPGAFAVVLRRDIVIHSPLDTETICLPEGTPLLGMAQVIDLAEVVHQHLHGSLIESELRLGVALLLGRHPAEHVDGLGTAMVRANINDWLGKNTAFIFWPRMGDPDGVGAEGFFAGVARSWAEHFTPRAST